MADKHIEGDGLPGQPFTFEDLEPWPTPVDSAALLTTLADIYTRYIVLPSRGADTLALWTIHTYAGRAAGLVVLTLLPLGRVAAVGPGDFDTSFGTGGKVAAVFDPRHNDCRWVG
jgi:hypothetical protein